MRSFSILLFITALTSCATAPSEPVLTGPLTQLEIENAKPILDNFEPKLSKQDAACFDKRVAEQIEFYGDASSCEGVMGLCRPSNSMRHAKAQATVLQARADCLGLEQKMFSDTPEGEE